MKRKHRDFLDWLKHIPIMVRNKYIIKYRLWKFKQYLGNMNENKCFVTPPDTEIEFIKL